MFEYETEEKKIEEEPSRLDLRGEPGIDDDQ
jgi:hypothetical protein